MRMQLVVLAVLLALMAGMLVASAASANNLLGAVSFPIWSERTTEAHAGVTQLVTLSDSAGGPVTAFYKNGFLVLPIDRYGVFADLQYIRIDPMVLGIKPEFIRKVETRVNDEAGIEVNGDQVVVSVRSLQPDLYSIVTSVTQNQGREDERGILPKFLQLFGRKTHHQVAATDTVAGVFGVVNASLFIEDYCKLVLGISDPTCLTPEQKRLVKSAFFDSRLKGVLEFTEPLLDYSLASQGIAMRNQGLQPPLSSQPAAEDPRVSALQAQNAQLQGQIQSLSKAFDDLQKQLAEPETDPTPTPPTSAPQAAPQQSVPTEQALLERFKGNDVYVLALDDKSMASQVQVTFWALNDAGWHAKPLVVSRNNAQFVRYANLTGYREIGLSESPDERPERTLTPSTGVHVLMINGGEAR